MIKRYITTFQSEVRHLETLTGPAAYLNRDGEWVHNNPGTDGPRVLNCEGRYCSICKLLKRRRQKAILEPVKGEPKSKRMIQI